MLESLKTGVMFYNANDADPNEMLLSSPSVRGCTVSIIKYAHIDHLN